MVLHWSADYWRSNRSWLWQKENCAMRRRFVSSKKAFNRARRHWWSKRIRNQHQWNSMIHANNLIFRGKAKLQKISWCQSRSGSFWSCDWFSFGWKAVGLPSCTNNKSELFVPMQLFDFYKNTYMLLRSLSKGFLCWFLVTWVFLLSILLVYRFTLTMLNPIYCTLVNY